MAIKCPFCQSISHGRSSLYESNTVKKTYYQCQNLECSCTFTALEAVHTIITRPQKEGESLDSPDQHYQQEPADRLPRTLNRYGSSSKLSSRQQVPV